MKAKKVLILFLSICVLAGCTVCGAVAENNIHKVAFLAPIINSEYWMTITSNTKAAAEAASYDITIYSAENDGTVQLQQIENCITAGMDAIIIDPLDSASADDALIRAREAGIYVIETGSVTETLDAYDIGIGVSETQVGDAAAKAAAEWIDKTFPDAEDGSIGVALFTFPFRPIDVERCEAFKNVTNYTSKANIVVTYELSLQNYQTEVMEYGAVMLQNYPDVKCVISYSDMFSNAIDEIFKGMMGADLTKLANIAIDQSTATYTNIKASQNGESTVVATVVPGITLDQQIVAALNGTLVMDDEEHKMVYKEITVVNNENIDEYFGG